MCEQCSADAKLVIDNVLPGLSLYQSKQGTLRWPKQWFGLVHQNDPLVVFQGPLVPSNIEGLTDPEIDALLETATGDAQYSQFVAAATALDLQLKMPADSAYVLVKAAVDAGYNPDEDGQVCYWLMHYLATKLNSATSSK